MSGSYSKETFLELVRRIFFLLRQQNPKASAEALKNEAALYGRFILFQAVSWQSNQENPVQNTYEDLRALRESMKATIKALDALPQEAQMHIWINEALKENPLQPDRDGWERLQGLMYESDEIIANAFQDLKPPQRGRPKQPDKKSFIEAVIQVFETVKGFSIESLEKLPVKNQRKMKTELYEFLDLAVFDEALFQSKEARRKFVDRYLESGRDRREDISDRLKDHIEGA